MDWTEVLQLSEKHEYRRSQGLTPGHQLRLLRHRPPLPRRRRPAGPPLWGIGIVPGAHEYDPEFMVFAAVPWRGRCLWARVHTRYYSAELGTLTRNLWQWLRLRRREARTLTMYRFTAGRGWAHRHCPTIREDYGEEDGLYLSGCGDDDSAGW